MNACTLCGEPAKSTGGSPLQQFACQYCGEFSIVDSRAIPGYLPDPDDDLKIENWKISAFVRERFLKGRKTVLFPEQRLVVAKASAQSIGLDQIADTLPKNLAEQLDRTLLNFSRMSHYFGDDIRLCSKHYPLVFGKNSREFDFILGQLKEDGYIRTPNIWPGEVQITFKGYNRIAELQRAPTLNARQAFVAMCFKPELLNAYTEGIAPAIRDCGFEPMRVDGAQHNEDINDFIIAQLRKSRFLVADFTGHRNGVYFEAGFMLGLERPVIFTCRQDQLGDAHFDTNHRNHVLWSTPEELRINLRTRIQASIPDTRFA